MNFKRVFRLCFAQSGLPGPSLRAPGGGGQWAWRPGPPLYVLNIAALKTRSKSFGRKRNILCVKHVYVMKDFQ